jgi:hypothetical protein
METVAGHIRAGFPRDVPAMGHAVLALDRSDDRGGLVRRRLKAIALRPPALMRGSIKWQKRQLWSFPRPTPPPLAW